MPDFNSGYLYNAFGDDGGAFYNTDYLIIFDLREVLKVSIDMNKLLASYAVNDSTRMRDAVAQFALFDVPDDFTFDEYASYSLFFAVTDSFGITDEMTSLMVLSALHDDVKILEDIQQFNEYLLTDEIELPDDITLDVLLNIFEEYELNDLKSAFEVLYSLHEREGIIDGDPKSAISDFTIGAMSTYDNAYDWFLPFGMKVDWNTTSIQVMPEASVTSIEMPGVDGSIVEDTVYKDRLFNVVMFSEQGMTETEKEALKVKITQVLDATKHQTKKLSLIPSDTSFDVKYEGIANITDGPSYVKATVPLRASAYGYRMFESEVSGNGLINNEGDTPNGPKHTITGPITNPSFRLGDITYKWTGTVPSGSSLVIDHAMMTCYIQNAFGVKTNALRSLEGDFQKIPARTSVALVADSNTVNKITTHWRDRVLW